MEHWPKGELEVLTRLSIRPISTIHALRGLLFRARWTGHFTPFVYIDSVTHSLRELGRFHRFSQCRVTYSCLDITPSPSRWVPRPHLLPSSIRFQALLFLPPFPDSDVYRTVL